MKIPSVLLAVFAAFSISVAAAWAQTKSDVDKLYILNCGEGVAGDISRWSPGVNVGKSMDFVDNCYLMHHAQGWLLWDTRVADAIAGCQTDKSRLIRGLFIGVGRRHLRASSIRSVSSQPTSNSSLSPTRTRTISTM